MVVVAQRAFCFVNMADKKEQPTAIAGTAQVKIGHYILGDTLGVGTFGKVKSKYMGIPVYVCFFIKLP